MSSVFLNSPSTRITFPLSSTSVHRNLGSRDAFADKVFGVLNIDPWSKSSRLGRSSGFRGLPPFLAELPHSLSCQDRACAALTGSGSDTLDRKRVVLKRPLPSLLPSRRGSRRRRGSRSKQAASRVAARRPHVVDSGRGLLAGAAAVLHWPPEEAEARAGPGLLGLKKATSGWERRNRRRFRDGTGKRNGVCIAAMGSPWTVYRSRGNFRQESIQRLEDIEASLDRSSLD